MAMPTGGTAGLKKQFPGSNFFRYGPAFPAMKHHSLILIISCLALAVLPAKAEKFHVAIDGKDGSTFSRSRPLKSIQAAVDAALRAKRAPAHTIFIGPGTYLLDQPITIDAG